MMELLQRKQLSTVKSSHTDAFPAIDISAKKNYNIGNRSRMFFYKKGVFMIKTAAKKEQLKDGPFYGCIENDFGIHTDENVPVDYAEKCVNDFFSLSEEAIDLICRSVKAFCLKYAEECESNGYLDKFLNDDLTIPIYKDTPDADVMKCVGLQGLHIPEPKNESEIGYCIGAWCDWEPEHGLYIIMLNGKPVCVGTSDYMFRSPWEEFDKDDDRNYVNCI